MTAKKSDKPKVDLKDEINRLMTPDAAKELSGLSPTFQQFLIRWIDLRDFAIVDEMKGIFQEIYIKDNEEMCKNVSSYVCKQVAETISPIWLILEELGKGQKEIINTLDEIGKRLDKIENRVYEIDEKRFRKLEKRVDSIEQVIEKIEIKKTG
jgi:tetrahydromethanopterin S-methyltransferase subunit G